MATYLGGDITEIVAKHPSLGTVRFATKSNESYTMDKGGIRNNDDANQVAANGAGIYQKNRVRWSFEGPVFVAFGSSDTTPEALSESSEETTWVISHISGVTWQGKGMIVGDLQVDTNTAQMSLKVAGGGQLKEV